MVEPNHEPQEVNYQTVLNVEKQFSIVNDDSESEDDSNNLEKQGACCDCEEPDFLADGYNNYPNFGHIEIRDSSNCHIGSNTYYQGPVTVLKQIVVSPISIKQPAVTNDKPVIVADSRLSNKNTEDDNCIDKVCRLHLCPRTTSRRLVVLGISAATGFVVALAVIMTSTRTLTCVDNIIDDSTCSGVLTLPRSVDPRVSLDNDTVRVCSRADWTACPPLRGLVKLSTPVQYVILMHSGAGGCETTPDCKLLVRVFQKYHTKDKQLNDISYNFLIGGDGVVYEGRGWDKQGDHTSNWNFKSIGICVIGNFITEEPLQEQVQTALKLIDRGVDLGKIARGYKLLARCQLHKSKVFENRLFALIKQWPHWDNGSLSDDVSSEC